MHGAENVAPLTVTDAVTAAIAALMFAYVRSALVAVTLVSVPPVHAKLTAPSSAISVDENVILAGLFDPPAVTWNAGAEGVSRICAFGKLTVRDGAACNVVSMKLTTVAIR